MNARTQEANRFATYSSGGPAGTGSKLTIQVNNANNNSSSTVTGSIIDTKNIGGGSKQGAGTTVL